MSQVTWSGASELTGGTTLSSSEGEVCEWPPGSPQSALGQVGERLPASGKEEEDIAFSITFLEPLTRRRQPAPTPSAFPSQKGKMLKAQTLGIWS